MQSNKSAPPGPISPAYDSDEEQLFRNKDPKNEVQGHSEISSQKSVEVSNQNCDHKKLIEEVEDKMKILLKETVEEMESIQEKISNNLE